AEDLSYVGTQTADLVTVAQAMHFMDLGRFYPEVERVLKPGGSFVSYGYGLSVLGDQRAEEALHHFYKGVLGQYWTEERNKVVEHYQGFSLPFPEWRRNDSLKMKRTWSVDELIGYLSSWTAWHEYLLEHPNSDAMEELRQRLKQLYRTGAGEGETERPVHVFWPVFMLMGHKPVL
ncbi:hypothetical protein BaRGS_00034195, partial [Batillaria attramentaria]